jgi:glycosyltransferase involved in cell wall biosynthesis/SAM-dependent methyltransferase
VRLDGVEVLQLPADRNRPWTWVFGARYRAARMAARLAADVVIAHQPIIASGVARAGRAPLVYVFHSPGGEEYRTRHPAGPLHRAAALLLHRIEARVLARADRVVVLSEFSRDQLVRWHGLEAGNVLRIPGGVDPGVFRPAEDRAALRRRLDQPAAGPLLITVRNLVPRMGLDDLIRAMVAITGEFPGATLLIGGEGPLRDDLERLAEAAGVARSIRFLGYVPEERLPDLLAAADLFVLPTRMLEGFGLVTVEALACGTPVVGTPVGATPELLGPLGAGLLLPGGGGPVALAGGILARLRADAADPAGAGTLRRACREHALAYDWERAVDALEGLVRDLAPRPCPFCGEAAGRPVLRGSGRAVIACAGCGTYRRHPAPDPEALSRYYSDDYAARFLAGSDHPRRRAMFASLLKRLGPGRGRRLLDLGAGSGLFVRMAREAGWEADGTELSTESRAWAHRHHDVALRDPAEPLPGGRYDVVSLLNVLDQAPDPAALLRAARAVLRPGGRLLLRVPNAALHVRWIRATARLGWGSLAVLHGYGFTPASLRAALLAQGFRVLALRNAAVAEGAGVLAQFGPLSGLIRGALAVLAGIASGVSAGRLLWGPSLEAEAERLPEGKR